MVIDIDLRSQHGKPILDSGEIPESYLGRNYGSSNGNGQGECQEPSFFIYVPPQEWGLLEW